MSTMRIGIIDWSCDPARPGASGNGDLAWGLAGHLGGEGHDVHVISTYPTPAFAGPVTVHEQWQPPLGFGYRNVLGQLALARACWPTVRRIGGLDVVHSFEYVSAAF